MDIEIFRSHWSSDYDSNCVSVGELVSVLKVRSRRVIIYTSSSMWETSLPAKTTNQNLYGTLNTTTFNPLVHSKVSEVDPSEDEAVLVPTAICGASVHLNYY